MGPRAPSAHPAPGTQGALSPAPSADVVTVTSSGNRDRALAFPRQKTLLQSPEIRHTGGNTAAAGAIEGDGREMTPVLAEGKEPNQHHQQTA